MYKIRDLSLCISLSFILDNYNYESMNEFIFIFSGDKYSVLPYKKDDFNSLLELLQKDIDQVYLTFRIHLDFRVDFVLSVLFHKNSKTWLGSFWFYNLPSFTCGIFKKLQLFHLMALKNIFSNTKRSSKSFYNQLFFRTTRPIPRTWVTPRARSSLRGSGSRFLKTTKWFRPEK